MTKNNKKCKKTICVNTDEMLNPNPKINQYATCNMASDRSKRRIAMGRGVGTILTWAVPGVSLNLAANFGKMAELERFKKSCLREINILAWESSESEMKKRL